MLIIGYVTYIYLDNMEKFLVEPPQLIPTTRRDLDSYIIHLHDLYNPNAPSHL